MDVATALGASVVGLCTTALLFLFYGAGPTEPEWMKERRLSMLKRIRVGCFVIAALGQAGMGAWRAIQGRFMLAMYDAQLVSTAILWALTAITLIAVWKRQAAVSLLPVVFVSLAVVGLQMATDCLHSVTQDFNRDDRIVGVSLHTCELGVLLFVCMAEALYGHMASLPLSELEEPLFGQTEKEKEKEAEKRASKKRVGTSRAQRTARAFRYVWPDSRPLRLRLVACFMLVLAERCVNLAVPVLYKNMVDQLSGAAVEESGGGEGGVPAVEAARALAAAAVRAVRTAGGSGGDGGEGAGEAGMDLVVQGRLYAAAVSLIKAAQQITFWSVFYPWVFAYLGFYFLRGGSGMEGLLANMRDLVWIPITQAAFRRISLDVFGHLLDLDHAFHLHRKTGQIMRILDRGTSSIQDTVSIVLFNVIPQLIDIVVACTYLALRMQPWAAVIVFITVASYVPLTVIITERRGVIRKRMNALDNAREGRATDMLLNYETVKYFCNERFELAGYDHATRQYQAAEYWQMAFLAMLSITQASVVWLGLAAGMVVCVRGVVHANLTVGDAVLFVTMMNQLYVPLTFFGSYYRQVQKALIDMENMFELLDTEPSVRDRSGAGQLLVGQARVDFDRVVFAYAPASPPVLKGVSFSVPGGKTLAVVGATGSGKSTILRLLLRFYDPTSGRVLIDGQDIRTVTQESLRRAVAVVPQDTVMFNDTVLYNIRYGRTNATDEEVHEAASVAHIHSSIVTSFKKGYATRVGERGLRLSGGEKQRVAFARAVLKRPALLVLDEATSALDSLTELAIQSSLQTLRSRCTTVIVAHRLSTIMDADLILVLNRGEVAQFGSHCELMEEGGLYGAMWSRQQDTAGYTTPLVGHSSGGMQAHALVAVHPPPGLAGPSTDTTRAVSEPLASNGPLPPRPAGAIAATAAGGTYHPPQPTRGYAPHNHNHHNHDHVPQLPLSTPPRNGGGNGGDLTSPQLSSSRTVGGSGGGLPRVPSRLMRRAILNAEMSDSGEPGALSRNPTPRRARALAGDDDEADERLYEDREPEDGTNEQPTPTGTAAGGAGPAALTSPDNGATTGGRYTAGLRADQVLGDLGLMAAVVVRGGGDEESGRALSGSPHQDTQCWLPPPMPAAVAAAGSGSSVFYKQAVSGRPPVLDKEDSGSPSLPPPPLVSQTALLESRSGSGGLIPTVGAGGGGAGGSYPWPGDPVSVFASPTAAAAVFGDPQLPRPHEGFGSPLNAATAAAAAAAAVSSTATAAGGSDTARVPFGRFDSNGVGPGGSSNAAGRGAAFSSGAGSPSTTASHPATSGSSPNRLPLPPGHALLGAHEEQERRLVAHREQFLQGKGIGLLGGGDRGGGSPSGLRAGRKREGSGSGSASRNGSRAGSGAGTHGIAPGPLMISEIMVGESSGSVHGGGGGAAGEPIQRSSGGSGLVSGSGRTGSGFPTCSRAAGGS